MTNKSVYWSVPLIHNQTDWVEYIKILARSPEEAIEKAQHAEDWCLENWSVYQDAIDSGERPVVKY